MSDQTSPVGSTHALTLRRVLGLRELVIYGLVLIQPTAPMSPYGVVCDAARGHVVTTILIGLVAMLFTAFSYGRMANAYPTAGSAYTYVGKALHPALGYLTGWSMLFDYVMNPIICVIWCSKAVLNFGGSGAPGLYAVCVILFAAIFTLLNLRGIQASARTNLWLAAGLCLVIVLFFVAAVRYLAVHPPAGAAAWLRPFYDPSTFSFAAVSTGTSIAVLTYIGFDGISTLSEEVENPRRNVLYATVLTCLITGVLAAAQVYLAQLVWPDYATFPDKDTAFVHIAGRAGGPGWFGLLLFWVVNGSLLLANMGSGMGAHLGAGRLLYGMGRDNAIPRRFFGALHPRTQIPANNILLVGVITLLGAFLLTYDLGAQLLNFGAFIAFMGVNASCFVHYGLRQPRRRFADVVPPLLGVIVCAYLWLSLSPSAKLIGFSWVGLGVLYGAWRTGGYRRPLAMFAGDNDGKPA